MFDFSDRQLYGDQKEAVDERWGVSPRQCLQFLGTEVGREALGRLLPDIGSDFWVRSWYYRYLRDKKFTENVALSDVRFPNEAQIIRKRGGILIKVVRPHQEHKNMDHASETQIDSMEADIVIQNDTTLDDLVKRVDYHMQHTVPVLWKQKNQKSIRAE